MIQQILGWHGMPPVDGKTAWVHTPDETWADLYPTGSGAVPDVVYGGAVHTNVDVYVTTTKVELNDRVITNVTGHHLICRDCGAEQ
jgi:hypothetical protein